ncbi:hypothetical protein SOVF_156280, partial [Spinacia oleracea]
MGDDDKSKAPRYEPFSEYYLHPSEGTGAVISPILLKGDNYEEWSRSLRNNLRAKNKLVFIIDGTIDVSDATSDDFNQWGIVNSMLVAWIFNTLDVSVRSTMRFPENVKSLWDDLRDRYSLGNGPRILELKNKITDCKQRGRPVAVYYGELSSLQYELSSYTKLPTCTCSAANEYVQIRETEMLHQFCIGLESKKFGSVVSNLLMMDPLPSLNVAYSRVIADERKQTVSEAQENPRPDAVGFATNGVAYSRSGKAVGDSDGRLCTHCGRAGHEKDKCFELVGFPEWYVGGSRGGRGGRSASGRGSRGSGRSGRNSGRGFTANVGSSRGGSTQEVGEADRSSAPTLTDEQWAQFMAAFNRSKPSSSS